MVALSTDLTAKQLGWLIADAVDNYHDDGFMTERCWTLVAKQVAAALKLRLTEEEDA